MNKNVCAIVAVVCSAILSGACAPDESSGVTGGDGGGVSASASSSSGTGGEVPATGKSPAIEAFQASRRAAHQDPAEIAAIDAQTATAAMVDISADVEAKRVQYVLDWTIDDVEQPFGQMANVNFDRGGAPRAQDDAESTSASFASNAAMVLGKLPEQPWDAAWVTFCAEFITAQSAVVRPAAWANVSDTSVRGALDSMKIIAIYGGAKNIEEALASNGGIRAQITKNENDAFRALVSMTAE